MPITLLLAEDHDANRQVIRRRLERRGFIVAEARDGVEAVDAFNESPADCVLLDLSMPNMSGMEALAAIRRSAAGKTVPAVAITAHAMDSMREKCLAAGFNAFVTKPMDFEELVSAVSSLTSRAVD